MRHEISTSWFTTSAISPDSPSRKLAVVLDENGTTGVLVHGASGDVAHVVVKSGHSAVLRGREAARDACDPQRSRPTAQTVISILAAALIAAALTHSLWLAAID